MKNLRTSAWEIWQAGVDAVNAERATRAAISWDAESLEIQGTCLAGGDSSAADVTRLTIARQAAPRSATMNRITVVGGGKAADGMARGVVAALAGSGIEVTGLVMVPDNLGGNAGRIELRGGRPVGANEPTAESVRGSREILELVSNLSDGELCLCLLTGGGSALLAAPSDQITLEDKLTIIRHLSAAGANIHQLNAVRRCLSNIKGGGLAARCRTRQLVTLLVSDVLGDSLADIASGPTILGSRDPITAREVLQQFGWLDPGRPFGLSPQAAEGVERRLNELSKTTSAGDVADSQSPVFVLANLQAAMEAAAVRARQLGYTVQCLPIVAQQPLAEAVGADYARQLLEWMAVPPEKPTCLIGGGEPVVQLIAATQRGSGGRNQQLVLAALEHLLGSPWAQIDRSLEQNRPQQPLVALLAGGTDGEDGPTDAAGGLLDAQVFEQAVRQAVGRQAVRQHLQHNNAYPLLDQLSGLIRTGWTGTNVCDLHVLLYHP